MTMSREGEDLDYTQTEVSDLSPV